MRQKKETSMAWLSADMVREKMNEAEAKLEGFVEHALRVSGVRA